MATPERTSHDLSRYWGFLRRRVWIIVVVALVVTWARALYTFNEPTMYRAEMKIVIELPIATTNSLSVRTAVENNAVTLKGTDVAEGAIRALRLQTGQPSLPRELGPTDLADDLRVVTKPETATLQVSYDDPDPARATRILRAVGSAFEHVAQLQPAGGVVATPRTPTPAATTGGPPVPSPTLASRPGVFPARVFDEAHAVGKVEPKPVRNVAVAALLGLLLGVVAGMVREQFDDTVRGVEGAEEAFGQPATVSLPSGVLGHRPFAEPTRRGLDPVVAELAIQRLVADILWTPESKDTRTLLVTSARPEEGKTTVTANLAVELASAGYRVIVVEADLRRPMLHHYLELDASAGQIGLDAVIRGTATITSAMVEVPVWKRDAAQERTAEGRQNGPRSGEGSGRLRAIVARPGHPWPSEVGGERVQEILSALRSRADYVIFDAPPILVVPDAYPLVRAVDAVVAVVRSGSSARKSTASMSRLLGRLRAQRVTLVVTEVEGALEGGYYAYATPRPS